LNSEQLEKEVTSLSKVGQVVPKEIARPSQNSIPLPLKKAIAEEKLLGNSASLLSETFGVNGRTVSSIALGESSKQKEAGTEARTDPELLDHVNSVKEKIEKSAYNKIKMALRHITEADFTRDGISLREKTGAMKDIAGVIGTITKNNQVGDNNFAQFIFVAPPQKNENAYREVDVIDAERIG